jgi:hypothetical protein
MSISGRKNAAQVFQGNHDRSTRARDVLQDAIFANSGVHCDVKVEPDRVTIRTKEYADFLLAKKAIKDRTTVEIVWARIET